MLKKREAILVALVVTAFWGLILILTSNASVPYEICEPAKEGAKQAAKECTRYNIISFAFREIGAHLDIVSALITAIATAFIARYTFTLKRSTDKLFDASERQLTHLKTSAEKQLGAYIGIEWCKVISNDFGTTFEVEVQIKNSGQTPAFEVTHRIAADLQILHGDPLDFAMPERSPGRLPIAPGITFIIRTPIAVGGPSGTDSIGFGKTIFAWGRIDYEDVFDTSQHLEFRFRSADPIRASEGATRRIIGWRMDPEDDGNIAT